MKKFFVTILFCSFFLACDRDSLSDISESVSDDTVDDNNVLLDKDTGVSDKDSLPDSENQDDDSDICEDCYDNDSVQKNDGDADADVSDEDLISDDDSSDDGIPLGGACSESEECSLSGMCHGEICTDPYTLTWKISIVSVTLAGTNTSGEEWDAGVLGIGGGDPDPFVKMIFNGSTVIETEKGNETFTMTFSIASKELNFSSTDSVSFQVFEYDSTPGDSDDSAGEFADSWNGTAPGPIRTESFRNGQMIFSGSGTQELVVSLEVK